MPVSKLSQEEYYLDDIFADLDEAALKELDDLAEAQAKKRAQGKKSSPRKRPLSATAPVQSARPTKLHKPASNTRIALSPLSSNGLTTPSRGLTKLTHPLPHANNASTSCKPSVLTPTRASSNKKRPIKTPTIPNIAAAISAANLPEDFSWLDEEYLPSPPTKVQPAKKVSAHVVAKRPQYDAQLKHVQTHTNAVAIATKSDTNEVRSVRAAPNFTPDTACLAGSHQPALRQMFDRLSDREDSAKLSTGESEWTC